MLQRSGNGVTVQPAELLRHPAIENRLQWAGCLQALCFHTVCAVNAQTWLNCNETVTVQKPLRLPSGGASEHSEYIVFQSYSLHTPPVRAAFCRLLTDHSCAFTKIS